MSPRIGLALGGGAALGLAHIGVLKALAEQGISIDIVAGTSAGSFVGAAYCAGRSWAEIREAARRLEWSHLVSLAIPRQGMMRLDKLERYVENFTGDFSTLLVPFSAVATDLVSREAVVFSSGSVARAVRASCSIPGLFEPVRDGRLVLVDGGLVDDVPADAARAMGADIVIAVNLHARRQLASPPRGILDIAYYSFDILLAGCSQKSVAPADVVINPDVQGFSYRDLRKGDELAARGEAAMLEAMPVVRRLMEERRAAGS